MTIIKSKIVKETIDSIEQEQQENKLNWEQKVDDWKEKYIFRTEQFEELKKEWNQRGFEIEFLKEYEKIIRESNLDVLNKYQREIRMLEERLSEKGESEKITLLKEQHEKEIRELKRSKEIVSENYDYLSKSNLFIVACEKFNKEKDQLLRGKWMNAKKKAHDRKILLRQLENQNYLLNKELPPLPKKLNRFKLFKKKIEAKFQQLAEKVKSQKQELIARTEVRINN